MGRVITDIKIAQKAHMDEAQGYTCKLVFKDSQKKNQRSTCS
jgi:hypothetical protein